MKKKLNSKDVPIDNETLQSVASELNRLTLQYSKNEIKHYHYTEKYDKTFENYGITKKQFINAIEQFKIKGHR